MKNEEGKMRKKKRKLNQGIPISHPPFLILLLSFLILSCVAPSDPRGGVAAHFVSSPHSPFATYRDVPGVTAEEIGAIETLQRVYASLSFGANPSTEAFFTEDGKIGGFAALFCEWLSGLFGIRIQPESYAWNELSAGLDAHTIDFIGNLMPTEERRRTYFMSDPISERQPKMMRLRGSPSLEWIAQERLPRYALLRNSVITVMVTSATKGGTYEIVEVNTIDEAYEALLSGRADLFIDANTTVDSFPAADVYTESFFPLLFYPVSLVTANRALSPIISVLDKALRNGAMPYVNYLNNLGYEEYRIQRFRSLLTPEEKAFLRNSAPVPLLAGYYNYPVAFYNSYEGKWEGIAFDVLAEVAKFSGLTFQLANNESMEFGDLLLMLYNGSAHIFPGYPYTESQDDMFIWANNNFIADHYALLSKKEFPNVNLNEIANARVGMVADTVHAELFRTWFPGSANTRDYESDGSAFRALDRGEVDLIMSTKNRLLSALNYYELPNYKVNYLFSNVESSFAFNKNQVMLRSIVDKALPLIDTKTIVEQWMTKTYDYREKVARERIPLYIGGSALFIIVFAILAMFLRGRSEGKLLAKLVAEKTSTLSAILDAASDLIFCKDLDLNITECNKALEKYFNLSKSDIVGKDNTEAFGMPLEVAAQCDAVDKRIISEEEAITVEEFIPSFDGKQLLFETKKAPLIQDGKVTGLVIMSRDVTERKAAEEDAKKASEAKSSFVANMSHEMRTPMNVIIGLTDLMLEDDAIPGNAKETLKKVNIAGNTLLGLINDVLDISKVEAGKLDLTPVQYDVAGLLNDIITLNMVRIKDKPIVLKLEMEDELPSVLFGDDLRIKQVLNNLLSNAFKYTREGTVTLSVKCQRERRPDRDDIWVSFYVADTGIGIRKEDISKLFGDYNQVDTRANRKIEGTGLGLSITKKLVELMDGEISVESEYGKGTTFRARIRQNFVTEQPIDKDAMEKLRKFQYLDKKKQASDKLVRADISYARVLVVDDFPTNLDVAAGMLRKYGIRVDCLTNGRDAVGRIAAGDPVYNAVFMDHMMPGMDGVEATAAIRNLGSKYAANIPIIALTANAVSGSERMFLDNGFSAFLPKPFNLMTLDTVLQQWIIDKHK